MADATTTAYHEAGHVVATWLFGYGSAIERVSIIPKEDFLGVLQGGSPLSNMDPDRDKSPEVLEALENDVVILYAGPAAQKQYSPDSWHDFHGAKDFDDANDLVSRYSGGDLETEEALQKKLYKQAERLIQEHWEEVEAVAKVLLQRKELIGQEAVRVLETFTGKVIPRSSLFDHINPDSIDPFEGLTEE